MSHAAAVERLVEMPATEHVRIAAEFLATAERAHCSDRELLRAVVHAALAAAKAGRATPGHVRPPAEPAGGS